MNFSKKRVLQYEVLNPKEVISTKNNNFDVAFINKSCDKSTLEIAKILKSLQIKIIYDLDDNIFDFPSYSNGKTEDSSIGFDLLILLQEL